MKRSNWLVVVLCCLVGLLSATSALATITVNDQLSFKGEMRVRFFDISGYGFDDSADKREYFDQRYRLQTKFTPLEGVSAVIRMDYFDRDGSDNWGQYDWENANSAYYGEDLEINRGYLEIEEPQFKIYAGLKSWSLGENMSYENADTGLSVESTELPVNVRIGYIRESEGGSFTDDPGDRDTSGYLIEATHKWNGHKFKAFYAAMIDPDGGREPWLVGTSVRGKKGIFKYKGEIDLIGGEVNSTTDAEGLQIWLNGTAKVNDKLTVGVDLLYAKGTDDENSEQVSCIHDSRDGAWVTLGHGPFFKNFYPLGSAGSIDPADQGTGSIGGGLYSDYRLTDKLTGYVQLAYFSAENDSLSSQTFDDYTFAHAAARYKFNKRAEFAVGYAYETMDYSDGSDDDPEKTIMGMLKVKF